MQESLPHAEAELIARRTVVTNAQVVFRIAVSSTSHVAYIDARQYVVRAGNCLVVNDTETNSQVSSHLRVHC